MIICHPSARAAFLIKVGRSESGGALYKMIIKLIRKRKRSDSERKNEGVVMIIPLILETERLLNAKFFRIETLSLAKR